MLLAELKHTDPNDLQNASVSVTAEFLWTASGTSLSALNVFTNRIKETMMLVALSVWTGQGMGERNLVKWSVQ